MRMLSDKKSRYSRTSLQRTPVGPGPTVRPTGVRSFAGVLVMRAASLTRELGGSLPTGHCTSVMVVTMLQKSMQCKVVQLEMKMLGANLYFI